MTIIPCGHRIVVRPFKLEEADDVYAQAKKLGITIEGTQTRAEQTAIDKGKVISIGATAFRDFGGEAWCSVGDTVCFSRYGGKLIKDKSTGEEFLLLNDEDIVCKLEGED